MHSSRTIFYLVMLLFTLLFLSFCNFGKNQNIIESLVSDTSIQKEGKDSLNLHLPVTNFDFNNLLQSYTGLEEIVHKIAELNSFHCSAVSISGEKTEQYRRYEWMKKFAGEKKLLELTNHSNPVVRAYSFLALSQINSDSLRKVFQRHISDKESFTSFCGCSKNEEYLNLFFLDVISHNLTKYEIDGYEKTISKYFQKKEWDAIKEMRKFF